MASTKNERYGLMSFTGPAGRTYFDRDGVLQTADENEIREEYDPLTGAYRGMLIEAHDRTNYQPYSDFSDHDQISPQDGTLSYDGTIAPNGEEAVLYTGIRRIVSNLRGDIPANWLELYVKPVGISHFNWTQRFNNRKIRKINIPNDGTNADDVFVENSIDGFFKVTLPYGSESQNWYFGIEEDVDDENKGFYIAGGMLVAERGGSYIPTRGEPVTMPGEDVRFTDPAVFNNFERGAFHVDFRSIFAQSDSFILYRGSSARFLYYNSNNLRSYDGSNTVQQTMPDDSLNKPHKYQVSWGEGSIKTNVDGSEKETRPFDGDWGDGDLVIGYRWSGYIKSLDFTEPYSDTQARQITKRDASTIIGECPNGGYYDYNDLSTMLIESDESGILAEDRRIARVGDPIGAILDKSGHGNHLTASTDSRRGVLRFDGENYYIERDNYTIYGFDYVGDRSLTTIIALQNYSDNFIVLCNGNGGGSDYAMIYGRGGGSYLNWNLFRDPRHYFNGQYRPTSNRGDAHAGLTTDPILLRTLHQVQNDESTRVFVGGYTVSSWDLTGNEYGFAWGSRLSEDDAALVEQEMRQNMPAIE